MNAASIIFPHQLYQHNPCLQKGVPVYLVEHGLYFNQYKFHKQKLVLHRASMQQYAQVLREQGYSVTYIDAHNPLSGLGNLFKHFKEQQVNKIYYVDTVDFLLEKRIARHALAHGLQLHRYSSPNFICTDDYLRDYFAGKKRYYLTDFYVAQRKRIGIMLDAKGNPQGGKWTYDTENRKKMPAGTMVPPLPKLPANAFVKEAIDYVEKNFSHHYGKADNFIYPITHNDTQLWLENFLINRFFNYGIYQDAMVVNESYLFHAVLTPMLNIGLIDTQQVLATAIDIGEKEGVPVNSLEGFVRQVLGWREYIRAVYMLSGVEQRNINYWQHKRSIPASFYTGTTGIQPVDEVIKRLLNTGYNHHIERLMVLGNFMALCGFNPNQVYQWFMEMYIDAYDWVMVPNVYGMSQYADGGLMSTKPYISGSNYILKMSNYTKGPWCEVWDGLYWSFIYRNKTFFSANPRMGIMVKQTEKMGAEKLNNHLRIADNFIEQLYR